MTNSYTPEDIRTIISLSKRFDSMRLCCTMALGCENALSGVRDKPTAESFLRPLYQYKNQLTEYKDILEEECREFNGLLTLVDNACRERVERYNGDRKD